MKRIAVWSVVGLLLVVGAWLAGKGGIGKSSEASVESPAAQVEKTPERPKGDFVIAEVNGEKVYHSDFQIAVESLPENARAIAGKPAGKRVITEEIVKLKLLKQQAEKMGIDKDPEILSQVSAMRDNILAASALEKIVTEAPSDLQAFYEKYKTQFRGTRLRQVLVSYDGALIPAKAGTAKLSEAQAREKAAGIADRIRKGEDFATVARAESDDTQTAERGGELGMVRPGQLGSSLEVPIELLKENEVSAPIRSPYGFHIFQVTAREVSTFEQVRPALEQQGVNLRAQIVVNSVKESAKIEFNENFFEEKAP
ncbi:MAG: peptidylprolyl isomerase [Thermoanaerobaculia bacterium]